MDGTEQFSVYNVEPGTSNETTDKDPLEFLRGDSEHGWHVARNLRKPLNHLDFLARKEEIAARLNLHSTKTVAKTFDLNYRMLEEHQQRSISTSILLDHLASQLHEQGEQVSVSEIRSLLQEYATVRHMEFHPSDVCNLTCKGCTYGHDKSETKPLPINFPFEYLRRIAELKPRSMVITGGGEPTLYSNRQYRFQEVVDEVAEQNPGITLALTTNGTHKPPGDWPNQFSWIRLSLDAATEGTYRNFRGKPLFYNAVRNFLSYLDYDVRYVGVSFLFARSNIHEYAKVADFIFRLVKREKPHQLHKVNIQYRPLRRDPHDYCRPFAEAISAQQIHSAVGEMKKLAESSHEMEAFLREQTNATAIFGGNTHPRYEFSRCFYSQTFRIVRANGDLRPCFIRVTEQDFVLGNILRDSLEAIALNTLYVGAKRQEHCNSHGCRQCHVNYIFEKGLEGEIQPSKSLEVLADPMY